MTTRETLAKLNTMTKYPSIPTYHQLDKSNGRLLPEVAVPFGVDEEIFVTEKIDGTSARIIIIPEGACSTIEARYLIGSREHLLTAEGDLVHNPELGIVDAVRDHAARVAEWDELEGRGSMFVVYGEVFGGKINGAKNYTATGAFGFRIFDVLSMPVVDAASMLAKPIEQIAAWRDAGGQHFESADSVSGFAKFHGMTTTPALSRQSGGAGLPTSHDATIEWMRAVAPSTLVRLDHPAEVRPEGIVVRNADRTKIAKLRFEDYERTQRRSRK